MLSLVIPLFAAANGDTANKIGTFTVALAGQHHGVPTCVLASKASDGLDSFQIGGCGCWHGSESS